MSRGSADTLAPDDSLRLADFARACKAAARVVSLYPATHPAIAASLTRVAETAARLRGGRNLSIAVKPDALLLDGRGSAKPESAVSELAALLHAHLVGELRLSGDLTTGEWHALLSLVARPPDDVRAAGGIGQQWQALGCAAIDIRQINYAEVLRERKNGLEGDWDAIITSYLDGDLSSLDDRALAALFEIASDDARFASLVDRLVAKASEPGHGEREAMVPRVLQALADFVARQHPEALDHLLEQMASLTSRLTPEIALALIADGPDAGAGANAGAVDLRGEIRARLTDQTIADFVAQAVARDNGATGRLAQAFQALVPDSTRHGALLGLAEAAAAELPIGRTPDFAEMWQRAAEMLTTYSDENYVSDVYGRELATARANAVELERINADPPERIAEWRRTVTDAEIRRLQHRVLIDLLAIETRPAVWPQVLESAVNAVTQLVVTGEMVLAREVVEAIVGASAAGQPFAGRARVALERLRGAELMRNVITSIRRAAPEQVDDIAAFCRALGPAVLGPLVEALTTEEGASVKRLRDVILSFGPAGRAYADNLRTSPNPGARRTAVDILRAFGGAEALPDLAALLDDPDVSVQREALRAIVHIGTDEGYAILQRVLSSGTVERRDAIIKALLATRDQRAAPLCAYILEHSDHRGALEAVYVSAIQVLGKLEGDRVSVEALSRVLHRGEWWAPFRTQRLRAAAAAALGTCGSIEARKALEEAASNGSRGVRRAARAALSEARPPLSAGRTA